MSLSSLHRLGICVNAILTAVLLYVLFAADLIQEYPFFSSALLLGFAKAIQWLANSKAGYLWTESGVMLFRILAVSEALWVALPRPRLGSLLKLAALGAGVTALTLLVTETPESSIRALERLKLALHAGMAMALVRANMSAVDGRTDGHLAIMTIRIGGILASELVPWFGGHPSLYWLAAGIYQVSTAGCLTAWIIWASRPED